MDINQIVQLIGGVGFPIVACIWLACKFDKTIEEHTKAVVEMTKTLEAFWRKYEE